MNAHRPLGGTCGATGEAPPEGVWSRRVRSLNIRASMEPGEPAAISKSGRFDFGPDRHDCDVLRTLLRCPCLRLRATIGAEDRRVVTCGVRHECLGER
eukprot:7385538-Prymnesium_polylepis.2